MYKKHIFAAIVGIFPFFIFAQNNTQDQIIPAIAEQVKILILETNKNKDSLKVSPRTIAKNGHLELVPARDWTSGFYAGILWQLYEATKEKTWLEEAQKATALLEAEKFNGRTHDMGFKIYCSYGQGYRLTGNAQYKDVLIQSAKTLITRFNPVVGCLRSWDHNTDKWQFPVIVDNMLNLELLFAATKLTGDSTYYRIAVSHADKTLQNHFRPDGGSYHVVDYDPATGNVKHKHTHQGYAHESTWARGQAWALYGYTMCYRETGQKRYLDKALALAKWIQNHPNLPKDGVAYYDFDAPNIPNEPRDVSAAAVMVSALYELSTLQNSDPQIRPFADHIFQSLTTIYKNKIGDQYGFILHSSTGSKPHNSEVSVPLIYADYYYVEALSRKRNNF